MPRKRNLPTKVVREGNAQVKIYASPVSERPRYLLVYRGQDGRRKTRNSAEYNEAKLEAENTALAIHYGSLESLELTGEERWSHERAAAIANE